MLIRRSVWLETGIRSEGLCKTNRISGQYIRPYLVLPLSGPGTSHPGPGLTSLKVTTQNLLPGGGGARRPKFRPSACGDEDQPNHLPSRNGLHPKGLLFTRQHGGQATPTLSPGKPCTRLSLGMETPSFAGEGGFAVVTTRKHRGGIGGHPWRRGSISPHFPKRSRRNRLG